MSERSDSEQTGWESGQRRAGSNGYVSRFELETMTRHLQQQINETRQQVNSLVSALATNTARMGSLAEALDAHATDHTERTAARNFRTELLMAWIAILVAVGTFAGTVALLVR